ncbi:hypothetical protein CCR75_000261 [Bremia lactucae]|uniref:Dol-P-Glc:Glc(2)Man(9)GlcNAc(2)-PP-Dol alpha-1,2-glucosyltransferase n=1 Tax=Bremia lactucae TaxID=4779 RepID=A0A976FEG9_BRELC|nr:hypothetical protein CCR75_000261 [Bremia lactucae]
METKSVRSSSLSVLLRPSARILPVVAVLALSFSWLFAIVNKTVPDPYMDEIFHIPQAQKYCKGLYAEWDPKITTFPGLYIVSTLFAKAVLTFRIGNSCSVAVLRSINVFFAWGNIVLCVLLRRHVAPQDSNALLHALRITMFPPLFFFTFLYYTDGGSTFFVLLMLFLAERVDLLQYPPARGTQSGGVAVLFRQTNIVWVGFVAGTVVVRCVELAHSKFIYGSFKQDTDPFSVTQRSVH